MARLKEFVRTRLLTLALAIAVVSFILFPVFPVTQSEFVNHWMISPAYAQQRGILAPLVDLLERTGLYNPPQKGTPPSGRQSGGAGRGPICVVAKNIRGSQSIRALVPQQPVGAQASSTASAAGNEQTPESELTHSLAVPVGGLTIAPQPTFWFYVPYVATPDTPAKRVAQFVLLDESDRPILNELMNVELSDVPRLVEYPLPVSLQPEQLYTWYFSVVCDADKLSRNPTVRGWVQRISPPAELESALAEAPRLKQYEVYANYGLFFETINSLVSIRREFPYTNRNNWTILLNSFGIPNPNQLDAVESAVPDEREVVSGNQLPASM